MNTSTFARLGIVSLILLTATWAQAAAPNGKLPGVYDALKPFIAQNEIAGAVTMVVSKDAVLHLSAIGESDMAAHTPMKTDDIFWIASMTKPVTGVCLTMLMEEGKLSYEDQVSK